MTEKGRRMSQATYDLLICRKTELEKELRQRGSENDAGHQRANLHDNAGAENVINLIRANLIRIGNLSQIEIIQPREETDSVGIGNEVQVLFEGESDPESFILLGADDILFGKDKLKARIVSEDSPFGNAILGKKSGERVSFEIGEAEISVQIRQISKGNF